MSRIPGVLILSHLLRHCRRQSVNNRGKGVTGYLAFPDRAEFRFVGTLKAMKVLWMSTGVKTRFLSDPRFQFERV